MTTSFIQRTKAMSLAAFRRSFASQGARYTKPSPDNTSSLNLRKMGANRTVRIIVYGALGVAALAETTFWGTWAWAKFSGRTKPSAESDIQK